MSKETSKLHYSDDGMVSLCGEGSNVTDSYISMNCDDCRNIISEDIQTWRNTKSTNDITVKDVIDANVCIEEDPEDGLKYCECCDAIKTIRELLKD